MLRRSPRLNPSLTLSPVISSVCELFKIFEIIFIVDLTCCLEAASGCSFASHCF